MASLFRIAHNECIEFLRVARPHETWSPEVFDEAAPIDDAFEHRQLVDDALRHLLVVLPPAERACVVVKDVLGYTLSDIARTTRNERRRGQGRAASRSEETA